MLKDFQTFINEAITLNRVDGAHFLERVETRLSNLEIIGFTNLAGDKIDASNQDIMQAQTFFREVLSAIATPDKSKVFRDTTIDPSNIGLIRLGKCEVTLSSGEKAQPVFRVYERTDTDTRKPIFRTGKYFWIFSIGSQVTTIKLYNTDGRSKSDKSFLINKSIEHLLSSRKAELERISRVFSIRVNDKEDLIRRHQIELTPGGISTINLDLGSGEPIKDQLSKFFDENLVKRQETLYAIPDPDRESTFSLESIPKQMNITPNKVWVLEKNEKFNTWGALPIIQSKQISVLNGNAIEIKVGRKWLHWLKEPIFNTPLQIDRVIKKGDNVTLAKQMGNGNWLVNTGNITDISTDSTSSEFPYVKTKGWDNSFVISGEEATKIFKDYREVNENTAHVLSFSQWNLIN